MIRARLGLVFAFVLGAACAVPSNAAPECDRESSLILLAQSTPSASLLPCIARLPIGWELADVEIDSDAGRFTLSSDRGGPRAVAVTLAGSCAEREGGEEVPSGVTDVARYVETDEQGERYEASWYDVFAGGCVTYDLRLESPEWRDLRDDVTAALALLPRDELAARVRNATGGRTDLDRIYVPPDCPETDC